MLLEIFVFIAILSILILVHEMGHFFAARRAGVWVEEFGIGIPPRVWGKKVGETFYSINLLPFGGFVRLHGENTGDKLQKPKRAFSKMSKLVRTKIILAGVFMNFVLALTAFSIVYSIVGLPQVKIEDVADNSPAMQSGLLPGDIVRKVDGKETIYVDEFILALGDNVGREVSISVDREVGGVKDTVTKNVYVREEPPEDEGALGVVIVSDTYYPALYLRPFYGVYFGFKQSVFWTKLVLGGLPKLFSDITTQGVPKDIAGPVGIFVITSETVKFGYIAILNLLGILSVNLAIINVLPIPALDGGRLLFILIEGIIGRKVVPKVEAVIHTVGFVALITLLLALTIREVGLIVSQGFSGFVETIIPR